MIKGDIISIDYIGTRGGTRNLSKVIGRTLLNLCERMKSMKGFADEFRPPRVSSIPFFFIIVGSTPLFSFGTRMRIFSRIAFQLFARDYEE